MFELKNFIRLQLPILTVLSTIVCISIELKDNQSSALEIILNRNSSSNVSTNDIANTPVHLFGKKIINKTENNTLNGLTYTIERESRKRRHRRRHKPHHIQNYLLPFKGGRRRHKGKNYRRYMYPVVIGLFIAKSIIFPILLKALTIMSSASFVFSKMSLLTAIILGLKWFLTHSREQQQHSENNSNPKVEILPIPFGKDWDRTTIPSYKKPKYRPTKAKVVHEDYEPYSKEYEPTDNKAVDYHNTDRNSYLNSYQPEDSQNIYLNNPTSYYV